MKFDEKKHLNLGWGTEAFFQEKIKNRPVRIATKLVIATIVGTLIGLGIGVVVDKAAGYTPMQTASCNPDLCDKRSAQTKFAVNKFKDGKMGRVNGVPERVLFKHPAEARRILIRKIQAKMDALSSCTGTHCRTFSHSARWYYYKMVRDASCFGDSYYRPWSFGTPVCKRIQNPVPLTTPQVKRYSKLIFCGAAVAASWEIGGTAPIILGFAGFGCFFDFYLDML